MPNNQTTAVLDAGSLFYLAQLGGSLCGQEATFADTARNFWVTGSSEPDAQNLSKKFLPAAFGGGFVDAGYEAGTPEQGTFTVNARREVGGLPALLFAPYCELVIYEVNGKCLGLPNLTTQEWDFIILRHGIRNGSVNFADGSGSDNTTELVDSSTFISKTQYMIGRLEFAQYDFANPVVDETYFGDALCIADCDDPQAGNERLAKLLHDPFGGANPMIEYTTDAGETFDTLTLDIAALLPNLTIDLTQIAAISIDRAGANLIVTLQIADGADADTQQATGYIVVPTAGLSSCVGGCLSEPVHVAAFGYETPSNQPTDVYATNRCVFWSGMNGHIYASSRLDTSNTTKLIHDATVSDVDFTRIHGCGDTIVAVGAEDVDGTGSTNPNGVVFSNNNGKSWQAASPIPGWGGAVALTAVYVRSEKVWEVGTSDGKTYRTCDAGCSWKLICATAAGNPVDDIVFATDQIGYFVTENTAGEIVVNWTVDGGTTWAKDTCSTRIQQTFCDRSATEQLSQHHGYRIAIPQVSDYFVRANYIAIGGRTAAGTGCNWIGSPVFAGASCPA